MKRLLLSLSVLALIWAALATDADALSRPTASEPTTPHLDAIFLGRCYEIAPHCDCAKLWRTFYNITAYKDPNTITRDSYQVRLSAQCISHRSGYKFYAFICYENTFFCISIAVVPLLSDMHSHSGLMMRFPNAPPCSHYLMRLSAALHSAPIRLF